MDLTMGVGLSCATVIAIAWAYGAHRRPDPARWTTRGALSSLFTVAATILFATSLGFLISGLIDPVASFAELGPLSLAVILGAPVLAWFAVPRLAAPARAHHPISVAPLHPAPGNLPHSPGKPGKKAA